MSWNSLISIAVLAALSYGCLLLYVYAAQSQFLYFPNLPGRELLSSPASIGLDYQTVQITTADQVVLDGWFVPSVSSRGVILFFHGNAGNISHRLESLRIFNKLGYSTLIIDYRGYGRSQGKPSEEGTYLDAEAAWRYLVNDRRFRERDIVIFGRSLGGAIAARLAGEKHPSGLILESVFTSVPDMAAQIYPWLPVRWLSRFDYNVVEALRNTACPVLIVHSPDDEIIPFSHGRKLFAAAPEPKSFLEIRGDHNQGFMASGQDYIRGLKRFLSN